MSFINKLANNSLLDNVTINNQLNVGDEINTQDLVISRKITLLPEAQLDGNFLKTFTDNDEEIDLYEKISRIDAKNDANTVLHANNASAIATRYTKGETDSYFARNTNPYITGDIYIRTAYRSPYESLDGKFSAKVDDAQLGNYVTLEESETALSSKVDVSVLTADYVTKEEPTFNLTESDRLYVEKKHPLEDIKINNTLETDTNGRPVSWVIATNMKKVLDDRYKLITESQKEIQDIQNNKADTVDSVFKVSDNYRSELMQFMLYNERSELTETISLKQLLSEKANLEHIYSKEDVDVLLIDPRFQTTDDSLLTFYGSKITTLKALLADKMTLQDVKQVITALDLPEKNNPEVTGVLKINNKNVESALMHINLP